MWRPSPLRAARAHRRRRRARCRSRCRRGGRSSGPRKRTRGIRGALRGRRARRMCAQKCRPGLAGRAATGREAARGYRAGHASRAATGRGATRRQTQDRPRTLRHGPVRGRNRGLDHCPTGRIRSAGTVRTRTRMGPRTPALAKNGARDMKTTSNEL
ncbi:hypothetical protein DFJ74DRAFT_650407 [Hyaloraphidium curvatum]|nr:hypothetical protein DFJ74DRAFT_650407 [Hyaloraphidium curvatum]